MDQLKYLAGYAPQLTEPAYHQVEFDTRLFLTRIDLAGSPYQQR